MLLTNNLEKTMERKNKGLICFMIAVLAVFSALGARAQEVDLGELELGKEYELTIYKPCKATFTAPETGTIVASCTRSYWPEPYLDPEYTKPVPYTHSYTSNGSIWEFKVEAGVKYYFYHDFLFDGGIFSIDYAATELKRRSVSPAENSVVDISGIGQVSLEYNMNVSASDVTLSTGGNFLATGIAYVSGRYVSIQLKGENSEELNLLGLLMKGIIKPGDPVELSFSVRSANNPELVLEEKLLYVCPEKQTQAESVQVVDEFLSYWFTGDENGIIRMTFDAPLLQGVEGQAGPVATLQYGNPESEIAGDCYTTQIPAVVEGNTLVVDFTGVRRRPSDMIATDTIYNTMLVKISNVKDADGRYVYTGGDGSLGSFSYEIPYKVIDAEAVYEFTPASGTDIKASTGDIELWIQNYSSFRFDGVTYSYKNEGGEDVSTTKPLAELNPEVDEYGDVIIMIPVDSDLRSKDNLKISLANLMFADGVEREISAIYNVSKEDVGIEGVAVSTVVKVEHFTLDGKSVVTPLPGIGIVRTTYSDGTVVTRKSVK
jgi:hypothetical protein